MNDFEGRRRGPAIKMLMTPYGRFFGKEDHDAIDGNKFKDVVEAIQIQTPDGRIEAKWMLLGDMTIAHNVPLIAVSVDSKSPIYTEYYKATSGIVTK